MQPVVIQYVNRWTGRKSLFILLPSFLVLSMLFYSFWAPHAEFSVEDRSDICEAVLRYQFQNNASSIQQQATYYFVSLFGRDPEPAILARFKTHVPAVRPSSEAIDGLEALRHRTNGLPGLEFSITNLNRKGANIAVVRGGYYENAQSASESLYTVEHKRDLGGIMKWIVTEEILEFMA